MLDFVRIGTSSTKRGVTEVIPKFEMKSSKDLMIQGGRFLAVYNEETGLWSTDEEDVVKMIDRELNKYASEKLEGSSDKIIIKYMWDLDSGSITKWHKYTKQEMWDNYHPLDAKLTFSNMVTKREDYASKKLDYPLEEGSIKAYDELISVLYSEEERHKIEWAIGAIVSGDSTRLQKFVVLYGSAGTGKSTILNIIQNMFKGYCAVFDSRALGSASASFALEAFRTNPLVAIQHDGDLSRIEDNTRLNSLVSHEEMLVNVKNKSAYSETFNSFLLMGTNKPVKITDAKSGILRRLIDVTPTGKKIPTDRYNELMRNIEFEYGAIAYHCLQVYKSNPKYYDDYVPSSMMGATNDFYNYVLSEYSRFKEEDGTTQAEAWKNYKEYCAEARIEPRNLRVFKEELRNYFKSFNERYTLDDGDRVWNYYSGFIFEKFQTREPSKHEKKEKKDTWIKLSKQDSLFDIYCAGCLAQLANANETPNKAWANVKTTLEAIDTSKIHYVKPQENHIVIDFDLKDSEGNKSLELNIAAATNWPPTYVEVSKGGNGLHLHYIYKGDVSELSNLYSEGIEIKVFSGGSSLRRRLSLCNDIPIAEISSGLPLRRKKIMVSDDVVKSEKELRARIAKNLRKESHPGTKPSIDYIYKLLEDAYESGLRYDLSEMKETVEAFADGSSHHASYCRKLVEKMHFKSKEDLPVEKDSKEDVWIFYDVEVFPNLFLVNYKKKGDSKVVRLINPTPDQIKDLMRFKLIGFNCRRYDNHIMYARTMGYSNKALYDLSQRIINGDRSAFFGAAWDLSYTDVYDFASAGNKMSLKKFEIKLGIHHQELGLPWDQPVPEELWEKVAEYCDNDVIATEAVFDYLSADWTARQILADLAGMTVNDTTNSLTTKIIFGGDKEPQGEFCYRDLSKPVHDLDEDLYLFLSECCPEMMSTTHGKDGSLLPYFPGYEFKKGVSTYRGEEVGEGGYVYAEPGMYTDVALLDVASMHPHSTIAECLFGVRYTKAYRDIVEGRVSIKHQAWDEVNHMLDGKLTPYIQKVIAGEMTASQLANALKTAINSVYGLTSAKFDNPFRDKRNVDNIVAKRGALFMIDLKHAVQEKGFTVAHIKTDSIKIPNATPEIIKFVMEFGKKYGYTFEHEATYSKLCLVNDAVYVAKDAADGHWTATGPQFKVPYVFKTLFSKEPITFEDKCETKSATTSLYLDFNEGLMDPTPFEKEYEKLLKEFAKQASPNDCLTINGAEGLFLASIDDKEAMSEVDPALIESIIDIRKRIDACHNYTFIGKVGSFCPVKPNVGGGVLYREKDGKYYAVGGTSGYLWKESEIVKSLNRECDIDESYYVELVNNAIDTINQYGDFEMFAS